jgi:hypothetical protein
VGYFIAMIIGYVIGARSGGKDLDQLAASVKALRETEEFGDVVAAARSHAGHTLRELASMVDGRTGGAIGAAHLPSAAEGRGGLVDGDGSVDGNSDGDGGSEGDLVDQVRHIFRQR